MSEIVSQPIGYGDAEALLSKMGGEKVPTEWIGGLKIDYQLGPGFTEEFKVTYQTASVFKGYHKFS